MSAAQVLSGLRGAPGAFQPQRVGAEGTEGSTIRFGGSSQRGRAGRPQFRSSSVSDHLVLSGCPPP